MKQRIITAGMVFVALAGLLALSSQSVAVAKGMPTHYVRVVEKGAPRGNYDFTVAGEAYTLNPGSNGTARMADQVSNGGPVTITQTAGSTALAAISCQAQNGNTISTDFAAKSATITFVARGQVTCNFTN
jgi:hypothetical protein